MSIHFILIDIYKFCRVLSFIEHLKCTLIPFCTKSWHWDYNLDRVLSAAWAAPSYNYRSLTCFFSFFNIIFISSLSHILEQLYIQLNIRHVIMFYFVSFGYLFHIHMLVPELISKYDWVIISTSWSHIQNSETTGTQLEHWDEDFQNFNRAYKKCST